MQLTYLLILSNYRAAKYEPGIQLFATNKNNNLHFTEIKTFYIKNVPSSSGGTAASSGTGESEDVGVSTCDIWIFRSTKPSSSPLSSHLE